MRPSFQKIDFVVIFTHGIVEILVYRELCFTLMECRKDFRRFLCHHQCVDHLFHEKPGKLVHNIFDFFVGQFLRCLSVRLCTGSESGFERLLQVEKEFVNRGFELFLIAHNFGNHIRNVRRVAFFQTVQRIVFREISHRALVARFGKELQP